MTYLVIGGAGYIGSHTVYELIENNNKVVILDNLTTGSNSSIHPEAKFYEGDFKDKKILNKIFDENKEIEIVINFAASIVVSESVYEPLKYYLNNTYGVMILLESMKENNKKFLIFSSTAAVYGQKSNLPIREDEDLNPINPYGSSKQMSEKIIQDYAHVNDFKFAILRYFNVAGAHQNNSIGLVPKKGHKVSHLIPSISSFVFNELDSLKIFGNNYDTKDGTCIRDYIHVQDLAHAHFLAAKYIFENKTNLIVNVGSEKGFSVLEVVKTFEKQLNKKLNYEINPKRDGDPAFLVASTTKIAKILNFKPKFSLEEIVKTELAWRKKILKDK
ncbi:UDP-glucose 4-epimerase GalE [[Mycoplasma] mobile]|uniref:UDP-glucose 4-epimerase n=1 Tax=Mycoplasma mobile (strain ATCC 43663 / 163K / NCTC 11711) TaxID=267748 RepID=Q6KI97_MYCM1|nr:UDP-glucose 4-epimerase GalE [[Mycoplasma] mobile]AAT27679.1 udp-glucose 4-epimerase [Mycoplasma mobile 163K]